MQVLGLVGYLAQTATFFALFHLLKQGKNSCITFNIMKTTYKSCTTYSHGLERIEQNVNQNTIKNNFHSQHQTQNMYMHCILCDNILYRNNTF